MWEGRGGVLPPCAKPAYLHRNMQIRPVPGLQCRATLPNSCSLLPALTGLLQQHYCIAVGIKDTSGLLSSFGLPHYVPHLPPAAQRRPLPSGGGAAAGGAAGGRAAGGVGRLPAPPPRFLA